MPAQGGAVGQQVAAALLDRVSAAQAGAAQPSGRGTSRRPVTPRSTTPGTSNTGSATAVTVNAGEERLGVDFQLQLVPMARVEGMVIYPAGQDSGGVQVQLVTSARISAWATARPGRPRGPVQLQRRRARAVLADRANRRAGTDGPAFDALGRARRARRTRARTPRPDAAAGLVRASRLWATAEISVDGRNLSERRADVAAVVLDRRTARVPGRDRTAPDRPDADPRTLTPSDPTAAGRPRPARLPAVWTRPAASRSTASCPAGTASRRAEPPAGRSNPRSSADRTRSTSLSTSARARTCRGRSSPTPTSRRRCPARSQPARSGDERLHADHLPDRPALLAAPVAADPVRSARPPTARSR